MTSPFIEDVLNGATEWRVFSRTGLSALPVPQARHSVVEAAGHPMHDGALDQLLAKPLLRLRQRRRPRLSSSQ